MSVSAWLVHISDIHIGAHISGGGWFPRTQGHDQDAVEALPRALKDAMGSEEGHKVLVMSGDASARGADAELDMYRTLLESGFDVDAYKRLPPWRRYFDEVLELPGNHDYWSGSRLPNPYLNPNLRSQHFGASQRTVAFVLGSYHVGLHAMCSTCGSGPGQQVLAVGNASQAELAAVWDEIENHGKSAASQGLIPKSLVVTHHSPSKGTWWYHGISTNLRQWLNYCGGSAGTGRVMHGLLTGHVHGSDVVGDDPQGIPPEVRCATTLQANVIKEQLREFWVHELRVTDGQFDWIVTPWVFDGAKFTEHALRTDTVR